MKYRVTFELEAHAPTPGLFYAEAIDHLENVLMKHRHQLMWIALDRVEELPNGGMDGPPQGALEQWSCKWSIDEVRE